MAKTIDEYLAEITTLAGDRALSTRWFSDQVRSLVPSKMQETTIIQSIRRGDNSSRPVYGGMNLYWYDAKLKESLPYWDAFPLVVPIKKFANGFLGINFHYLSIPMRLKLLERMDPYIVDNSKIGWNKVAKIKYTRPCVKRYLAKNVQSRFLKISRENYATVCMLPVQKFKKVDGAFNYKTVHAESRRMIL